MTDISNVTPIGGGAAARATIFIYLLFFTFFHSFSLPYPFSRSRFLNIEPKPLDLKKERKITFLPLSRVRFDVGDGGRSMIRLLRSSIVRILAVVYGCNLNTVLDSCDSGMFCG